MAKKRLPPASHKPGDLHGPNVESWGVVSCSKDRQSPATAVAIVIEVQNLGQLVLRIKTPQRVDELIQMLLRHKRDVWPEAP